MNLVLSKQMSDFFGLIEKFAGNADSEDDIVINIELHIAGTNKTLKWHLTEKANLVRDAMCFVHPLQPESEAKNER